MDPLSITAGAVGLAAQALRAAFFVRNTLNEMQDAPAFTRDIAEDIIIVQGSLHEIERTLSRSPHAIRNFGLDEMFDSSVGGCHGTLERIRDEFDDLFGREDWRGRFAVWWNTSAIHRLLESLGTKKASLMLLVQALGLRSMQEMHELMERNQATLNLAGLGLEGMLHSYSGYAAGDLNAMPSEIGSVDGILGDRDSVLSDSGFAFDSVCVGSKAYRRTVARTLDERGAGMPEEPALPDIEEDEEEVGDKSEIGSSVDTAVPVPVQGFVEIGVHEAVCARLRDAEARILVLEAMLQLQNSGDRDPVGRATDGAQGLPQHPPPTGGFGGFRIPVGGVGDPLRPYWLPKYKRWSETTGIDLSGFPRRRAYYSPAPAKNTTATEEGGVSTNEDQNKHSKATEAQEESSEEGTTSIPKTSNTRATPKTEKSEAELLIE
ncbi:hypothetical protein B0T14DRAFT_486798 [Immersiella caudata]|uniref:Fungal N-terminal domain-containing protein n=1 Tax=Immersiella caudata TaxID=314043 RepID=A0AA39WFM5_9PEZI|nr:hypothetical protein B0T14DRAFT_486798 [Immersiella caudata]